ncbi:MAG: hypothetical protein AAGF06_06580 [Pseudomonadota bacterium]
MSRFITNASKGSRSLIPGNIVGSITQDGYYIAQKVLPSDIADEVVLKTIKKIDEELYFKLIDRGFTEFAFMKLLTNGRNSLKSFDEMLDGADEVVPLAKGVEGMDELGFFTDWRKLEEYISGVKRPGKLEKLFDDKGNALIRFPDYFDGALLKEVKNGRQSLSANIKKQIEKDVRAMETNVIDTAEWHFYPSSAGTKGKVSLGPSKALLEYLKKQKPKIKVVIHTP